MAFIASSQIPSEVKMGRQLGNVSCKDLHVWHKVTDHLGRDTIARIVETSKEVHWVLVFGGTDQLMNLKLIQECAFRSGLESSYQEKQGNLALAEMYDLANNLDMILEIASPLIADLRAAVAVKSLEANGRRELAMFGIDSRFDYEPELVRTIKLLAQNICDLGKAYFWEDNDAAKYRDPG
ncbi:MAG: hypothetical protein WD751_02975 [Anaerolineales bacterium]